MVFYTRDVQPVEAYVAEAHRMLIQDLAERHSVDQSPFVDHFTRNDGGMVYTRQTITDGLYHACEAMEEANQTGWLHEFDDAEVEDIIDQAVSKVFDTLESYLATVDTDELTTAQAIESINRSVNPYLFD